MVRLNWIAYFWTMALCCQAIKSQDSIDLSGLDWLPNRQDVQPGAILVPENHDDPAGKKIQITYVVLRARDSTDTEFPLIFFSGGPGARSLDRGTVNAIVEDPLRTNRDIILFDQRGIGFSSPLPDMSLAAFEIMARDANEMEEQAFMTTLIGDYKRKCTAQNLNPRFYNTLQSARDVGMLFKHLGYGKYNLLGISYGTRLGRVVQDMYPDYIHSSVLDSPAPMSGDFLLSRLESYSLSLGRIFSYCETHSLCRTKYPSLKQDYFKAIDKLKRKPLKIMMRDSMPVYINAQDAVYLIRRLLYQGNSREKAPELIHAFIDGHGQVILDVLQFEYTMSGELNLSMLLSVEKFENFNQELTSDAIRMHYKNYPLIPVKLGFFDAFYQAGMDWHTGNLPVRERQFRESDIPTLIFVNQFDPVTPPEYGHLFKEKLSRCTLLILDEGGHGDGNPECKDRVIGSFMDNPRNKPDISCLNLFQRK